MLNLDNAVLLDSGSKRNCFLHPNHGNLCVKVNKKGIVHIEPNKVEKYYLGSLKKRNVSFRHIAGYFGSVETNLGQGLVFERVCNDDGTPGLKIEKALQDHVISRPLLRELLSDVYAYLIENWISLADINKHNLLVKRDADGYRLVLVDGLGVRKKGGKLFLVSTVPFFARRKTKKTWKKMHAKLNLPPTRPGS